MDLRRLGTGLGGLRDIRVGLVRGGLCPRTNEPAGPRPMIWFLLAALMCALCYSALERTVQSGFSHVPLLPMYIVMFLDFLGSGAYGVWERIRRRK